MVAFSSFVVFIKLCPAIFVSVALCISDVWVVKVFLLPAKEIRLIWLEGTRTTNCRIWNWETLRKELGFDLREEGDDPIHHSSTFNLPWNMLMWAHQIRLVVLWKVPEKFNFLIPSPSSFQSRHLLFQKVASLAPQIRHQPKEKEKNPSLKRKFQKVSLIKPQIGRRNQSERKKFSLRNFLQRQKFRKYLWLNLHSTGTTININENSKK